MLKNLWQHKWGTATLAGVAVFLAFPCFYVIPTILLFPTFFFLTLKKCRNLKDAFFTGFFISFIIMLGGFYWVTYVAHEFGGMPWPVAGLLFLGFCGFGALNFPVFSTLAFLLEKNFRVLGSRWRELWAIVALPALYAIVEFTVPKLFPWYLGHCLYSIPLFIQPVEFTGSLFLSFALVSLGGAIFCAIEDYLQTSRFSYRPWYTFPLLIWAITLGHGAYVLSSPIEGHPLRAALIQANIGSLDKVKSRRGYDDKMRHTLDIYLRLTNEALLQEPKPNLILWPETAMPFQIEVPSGKYSRELRENVLKWQVPLITGGYGISPLNFYTDYNTAFLLDPSPEGVLTLDTYHKNILLAFGEYFPFGDWFPSLYKTFPEVSNFERGKQQNPFTLRDTTRLGVTICYEAIVPSFYRKVARNNPNAIINLTNDSWFGPTAEPYLHGALTVFRAVETRLPLLRVTNTGISFSVDSQGHRSELTPVYEEAYRNVDIVYPVDPKPTVYVEYGDWFVVALGLLLLGILFYTARREHASLPV